MKSIDRSDPLKRSQCLEISDPSLLVKNPRVSVLMITYNHAEYLAEAIEGVVKQQCEFPFELIIGEDASSDATLHVALKFQKRYPQIIRIIHSPDNVGMNANSSRIFKKARGEYITYCEGDDFWCSATKLAQQISLIESDNEIGIVHSNWTRAKLIGNHWTYNLKESAHRLVAEKYLSGYIFATWHYPKILRTCTILIRKSTMSEWYSSGLMSEKYLFGDSVLSAYITSKKKVGYIPDIMAVYRASPNSALRSGAKARVALYQSSLQFDTAARKFFSGNADYRPDYRWECAASLLLWGIIARDFSAVRSAILDFERNFTPISFFTIGLRTMTMRLPSLKLSPRKAHNATNKKG